MKECNKLLTVFLVSFSIISFGSMAGEWKDIQAAGVGEAQARSVYYSMISGSVQHVGPICRADGMFPWLWYCNGRAYFN
ncbi:hypothetical protein [Bowmanella denitrificans]|uniref:hypothetical protein n=1 Tax=Bowmanella denitrificans TaxID=366582 RepID=UPI0011AF6C4B|nr:hypothetical protein [Bowmanella denitrificans]